MNEKTDELLLRANEFLNSTTAKITPNVVLLIALLNGFIIGFTTTGYLGGASIEVKSLNFGLIVWQFIIICIFSARYVTLTVSYLNKFAFTGVSGFFIQWQTFGMYAQEFDALMLKDIQPIISNGFGVFVMSWALLMILKYCFSGNEQTNVSNQKVFKIEEGN